MYRGFSVRGLTPETFEDRFYQIGLKLYSQYQSMVKGILDEFTDAAGALDASKMRANWFPEIKCDVFISHSHVDDRTAISLAGWLKSACSLDAFVDSCAWGFSDDLLQLIDNEFCLMEDGAHYSYELRNRSTSHVHMMLCSALSMMIDNCECILFLDTPSSLLPGETITTTRSPWIYAEIGMTRLTRKRTPDEYRGLVKKAMSEARRRMEVLYRVDLAHLQELSVKDLNHWLEIKDDYPHALDALYAVKPV